MNSPGHDFSFRTMSKEIRMSESDFSWMISIWVLIPSHEKVGFSCPYMSSPGMSSHSAPWVKKFAYPHMSSHTWFPYEFLILSNENMFLISSHEFSCNENSLINAMFVLIENSYEKLRTHNETLKTIFVSSKYRCITIFPNVSLLVYVVYWHCG